MILSLVSGFNQPAWQRGERLTLAFLCFITTALPILGQNDDVYVYNCEIDLCEEISLADGKPVLNYEQDNLIFQKGLFLEYEIIDEVSGLTQNEHRYDTGLVRVTVNPQISNLMRTMVGAYHQTGVEYKYSSNLNISTVETGIIENARNIWLHPFRGGQLAKTNLNAYPFVKFPISLGQKYEWELNVGGAKYSDARWLEWSDKTLRKHKYEVVKKENMLTPFEENTVETFVIKAYTQSEIGRSSAKFWYNEIFGFVRIVYDNIDGTVTEYRLIKFLKP